jgi:PAS domain-containing protein
MTEWTGSFGKILKLGIVAISSSGAVLSSIFSLEHGIPGVFPFLYILPIILVVYFYPRQAVLFTFCISVLFISIVYFFGGTNPGLITLSTAWFSVLILIGIVASSYANRYHDEKSRIRHILDNAQEGILCLGIPSCQILDINARCAGWLRYERQELIGRDLSAIWHDDTARNEFCKSVLEGAPGVATEGLFATKDGIMSRFSISVALRLKSIAICSVMDITSSGITDEEIKKILGNFEIQIRARTAHLEKINEELRAEIKERRKIDEALLHHELPPEEGKRS